MKPHQFLFWILLLFLPTQLGKHFWPDFTRVLGLQVDYLSPTFYLTDLIVIGILLAWMFEKKEKRNKLLVTKLLGIGYWFKKYWYLVVFIVYLFLTSLIAQNSGAAIYKLIKLLELASLSLYVAKNSVSRSLALPLGLAVIYSSLLALGQFLKQGSLGGLFWFLGERSFSAGTPGIALAQVADNFFLRPYGTFSHPNSLSGFLLVALILVWGFGQKLPTWFKIVVSLLGILAIVLSFSLAVWVVGLGLGSLVISYKQSLWLRHWLLVQKKGKVPLVFSLLACWVVLGLVLVFFWPAATDQTISERISLSRASLAMVSQSPLWGVGPNNFIPSLPRLMNSTGVYLLQPVHNIYLLVVSETGMVGLIIFLWFLFLSVKKSLLAHELWLIISIVSILLLGLFDHYWLTLQQNMLLGAIAFGLVWGAKSNSTATFDSDV